MPSPLAIAVVLGMVAAATPPTSTPKDSSRHTGCLAAGNGYLRARIRGALSLDIDLHDSELECDGGARPNGSGIRVSFAGPVHTDGRRLRMVFGVGNATEGKPGRELPTNLTVIFEGEQRLFATRGEDKCTIDQLTQERVDTLSGSQRSYRVVARGFCIAPATELRAPAHILVDRFDFAGRITFEDPDNGSTP